ncbi:hypothetical protein [Gymnodinialimonas ulvae]|uniref:hypothetical protein n=1 Tax=Gymnodinialimonas ulvae TaxID=3126504 RepID=UPI0030B274CE
MTRSRRQFLLALAAGAASSAAGGAMAQSSPTDQVVAQVRAQGFEVERVTRTLLGRVRVVARRGAQMREVVFDPRNGAILRDYSWTQSPLGEGDGGTRPGQSAGDPDGGAGDDDDDDDDDDHGGVGGAGNDDDDDDDGGDDDDGDDGGDDGGDDDGGDGDDDD